MCTTSDLCLSYFKLWDSQTGSETLKSQAQRGRPRALEPLSLSLASKIGVFRAQGNVHITSLSLVNLCEIKLIVPRGDKLCL